MKKKEFIEGIRYSKDTITPELHNKLYYINDSKKKSYVISESSFYSNCLLEAVKRKIKNPFKVKIIPIINKNNYVRRILFNHIEIHTPVIVHWFWTDGKYDYEFTNYNELKYKRVKKTEKNLKIKIPFIIHGIIKKYPLGYAKMENEFLKMYYEHNRNQNNKCLSMGYNTENVLKWRKIIEENYNKKVKFGNY